MRDAICAKHGNAAGTSGIAGGTKTATAGIPIAIGMTTITIATKPSQQFALAKQNGAPQMNRDAPFFELP